MVITKFIMAKTDDELAYELDKGEVSHIDYIVDLSRLADKASLRMF